MEEYLGSVKNRTVVPQSSVPCPSHSTDCAAQARPAKCYESKYSSSSSNDNGKAEGIISFHAV